MWNNLRFWLSVDHIDRIKTYGLISHLKYMFSFNISRLVVNMQNDLYTLPELVVPDGYTIREMNINDENEIDKWIYIVNTSYDDANETKQSFFKHIYNHSFLTNQKVLFLMNELEEEIGTVTYGLFKKNKDWGGDSRIAILPSEKGKGLGYFMINYAFHSLRNVGIRYGEAVISFHRKQSIYLYAKCGFHPQFYREKCILDSQRRMWPVRFIARVLIKKQLRKFNYSF